MGIFGNSQSVPDPYAPPIDKKRIILVAALIGAVLVAIIFGLSLFSASSKNDVMTLLARENDLLRIAEKTKTNVRSGELSKANTEAILLLTSDSATLTSLMRTTYGSKNVDGGIVKRETDANAINDMKNAALLNKFDSSYRSLVRKKIADILSVANKIKSAERSKKVQNTIDGVINNAKTIDKRMAALQLD